MAKTVHARHTVSGKIVDIPEAIFNHPVLGDYYERVDADAKPYLPEMHVPTKAVVVQDTFEAIDDDDEFIVIEAETDKDND